MIDLYESEVNTIYKIVENAQSKHMNGTAVTWDKLTNLQNELEGRLRDASFLVTVDVTPLLDGMSPTVRIDGRVDIQEWDFEKKGWEVKKRVEHNDDDPNEKIEGVI